MDDNDIFITPAYEVKYDPVNRICRPATDEETEGLLVSLISELIIRGILFRIVPSREEISYSNPYKIVVEIVPYDEYLNEKYMKRIKYSFAVTGNLSEMIFYRRNDNRTTNSLVIRDKYAISEILRREEKKLIGCCYFGKASKDFYDRDCYVLLKLFKMIISEGFIISFPKYSKIDRIPLITLIKEDFEINVLYFPKCSENESHYKIEYNEERYDLFYLFFEKDYNNLYGLMNKIMRGIEELI